MRNKKLFAFNRRRGITLIELIVTLAIFSIVIVAIYNLLGFNLKVYSRSETLSQIQFDVRMAADGISSELRNANTLNLLEIDYDVESIENIEEAEDHMHINLDTLQSRYSSVDSVQFGISKEVGSVLLVYEVTGNDSKGGNVYTIGSEVTLNNIKNISIEEGIMYNTVIYKK